MRQIMTSLSLQSGTLWGLAKSQRRRWLAVGIGVCSSLTLSALSALPAIALCRPPALSRVQRHTVSQGETLNSIAQQYGLIAPTLQGFNPAVRQGEVTVGQTLRIPPYNGIQVQVTGDKTWADLAADYSVPADVLFELNGCQATVPSDLFVPGVNWFPGVDNPAVGGSPSPTASPLNGYPLTEVSVPLSSYGWQPHPSRDQLVFNSGVTLRAASAAPAIAVGDGVVAFAGQQEGYGNLVVINHAQGLQTRYANLDNLSVQMGQTVTQGTTVGQVAPGSGAMSYLYFEVRANSDLGWVAQNPGRYIAELGMD